MDLRRGEKNVEELRREKEGGVKNFIDEILKNNLK